MTNFLIINEETKEFVNIDSIDSIDSVESYPWEEIKPSLPTNSVIRVKGEGFASPFTPEEILSKIDEIRSEPKWEGGPK